MSTYSFRYLVRTRIDNSVVGSGSGSVQAETDREAVDKAITWVHDNNSHAEPRIDPYVELIALERLEGEDNCGQCWSCLTNHNFMIVCVDCGNKRCPKATDHHNACTGSNEPEQAGSVYGGLGPDAPPPSLTRLREFLGGGDRE